MTDPFRDHMAPSEVFWLADPAYMDAFRDLTGDTTMTEVGFTKPSEQGYPGFMNTQLADDDTHVLLTVRGDPRLDDEGRMVAAGATVSVKVPLEDWDEFIAQTMRMRSRAGQAPHPALPGLDD